MAGKSALAERRQGEMATARYRRGRRIKCVILPNEPTDLRVKTGSYVIGWQLVAQRKREVFRWVRFGKRTHLEGVLKGLFGKVNPI